MVQWQPVYTLILKRAMPWLPPRYYKGCEPCASKLQVGSQEAGGQLNFLARCECRQAAIRARCAAEGITHGTAAAATLCTWVLQHVLHKIVLRGQSGPRMVTDL